MRICQAATGAARTRPRTALRAAGDDIAVAVVMLAAGADAAAARAALDAAGGNLRRALADKEGQSPLCGRAKWLKLVLTTS